MFVALRNIWNPLVWRELRVKIRFHKFQSLVKEPLSLEHASMVLMHYQVNISLFVQYSLNQNIIYHLNHLVHRGNDPRQEDIKIDDQDMQKVSRQSRCLVFHISDISISFLLLSCTSCYYFLFFLLRLSYYLQVLLTFSTIFSFPS